MISALIGQDVKIVQILPNESHLGADYTLVIMDIIVETANGSVVNVEVQKIGYNFPPGSGLPATMQISCYGNISGYGKNIQKVIFWKRAGKVVKRK